MTEPRPFLSALHGVDRALAQERLGASANHRIAGQMAAQLRTSPARRWLPAVAFAAGAAVAVAAVGSRLRSDAPIASIPTAPAVSGFFLSGDACDRQSTGTAVRLRGACRARPDHGRLEVQTFPAETALVAARPDGVELREGRALFNVNDAAPNDPVHVTVPGGTIEVFGTKFFVDTTSNRGHVDLIEGKIRFLHQDGPVTQVAPGDRFEWSLVPRPVAAPGVVPPTAVEAVAPAIPKPRRQHVRRAPAPTVGDLVDEIRDMRREGRYHEAARRLEKALKGKLEPRVREVLSYELGDILTRRLNDREPACTHWAEHRARFPGGRYESPVRRAQRGLSCEGHE